MHDQHVRASRQTSMQEHQRSRAACNNIKQDQHAIASCNNMMQEQHDLDPATDRGRPWLGVVQDLTSLRVAQQNKSEAGRRRWDRNISTEGPKRLGHAEGFALRAHRSAPHRSKAAVHDGPFVPTQHSHSLATPPLPHDIVLTFTVYRFDRSASAVLEHDHSYYYCYYTVTTTLTATYFYYQSQRLQCCIQ